MSLKKCPVQDICIHYTTGDRKPPNHDIRDKYVCKAFKKDNCEMALYVQTEIMGLTVACKVKGGEGCKMCS